MGEPIEKIKKRLKDRYLGKYGIHGIGIRESENAVCIYVSPGAKLDETDTLKEIKENALPFKVIVIQEERPVIT